MDDDSLVPLPLIAAVGSTRRLKSPILVRRMKGFVLLRTSLVACLFLLAASDGAMGNAAAGGDAAARSESRQEKVLRTELVEGTVTALQMGDYLWATVEMVGRESMSVMPGAEPIDLFLDAHRGQLLTLEIATVRMDIPEAGGEQEVQRVIAARRGSMTAQTWWDGLSPTEKQAVRNRFEQGALSSGVSALDLDERGPPP
jgi:hypothetical protein